MKPTITNRISVSVLPSIMGKKKRQAVCRRNAKHEELQLHQSHGEPSQIEITGSSCLKLR
jgi:hypothetical protein